MKHSIMSAAAATLAVGWTPVEAAERQETVTPVFERAVPNLPDRSFVAIEVLYPPGAASASHTHPKSAFIYAYVLSGEIVSAVDDEEPRVYRSGESWYELPGARHRVSRNASTTQPAKLLAIFVLESAERELVLSGRK